MTVILDTNLLLLFIVGMTSTEYIAKHKRLSSEYTVEDYNILIAVLSPYDTLLLTPNTLTETSNLAGYIGDPARAEIRQFLRKLVHSVNTQEQFIESRSAVDRMEFIRLGLTDAALLTIQKESHTLLTVDLNLYLTAATLGLRVENFNHYRNL